MTADVRFAAPANESERGAAELAALAAYCAAPDDEVLAPDGLARWASARLLDGLAVITHGHTTPVSAVARSVFPAGGGDAYAWPDLTGAHRADDAAYLLGVSAFSENYADTGLGSVAHINSIVVPALLVAIQRRVAAGRPVTGREALAALVVGYNVMEWAGATLNGGRPRMAHQLRGFRPTPSAGPLAAVAVLGRLAGHTAEQLRDALGLACSQAGGLRPSTASPTSAIRIQSGEALRRSVHTVDLALAGIVPHPSILRCPGGFFPAYGFGELGRYDVPVAGGPQELMTMISMKLECTPHTLVTMLDAVRAIAARRTFTPADVESVTVRVPRQHNVISGGDKPYPTTFSEAAGHVPYCIAVAMLTGSHLFPAVIEHGLSDDGVHALTGQVALVVDDRLSEVFDDDPTSWPAAVEVRWRDGGTDALEMRAPETVDWSADDALAHAAIKAVALLGYGVGSRDELIEEFGAVADWTDVWARLRDHPFTRWSPEVLHGR
jgi:2-methylcitrate dehydratase PrpD